MHRFLLTALLFALAVSVTARAGTLVILNKAEATASLLDEDSGRLVATLPTGQGPHEVAVSPNGRLAVACDYGAQEAGATLTVIDVPRARVLRTIDLGEYRRPHGIAFRRDGRRVFVTVEGNQAVIEVDVRRGRVLRALPTGQQVSHMFAMTPDESRGFVANIGSGTVTALDLDTGEKLRDIATGSGAEGIDVTPDGRQVWITNRAEDTVTILDAATLEVLETVASASFPIRAKATPDGQHVLVTNARSGDLSVFDVGRRALARRVAFDLDVPPPPPGAAGSPFASSSVPIGILIPPDGERAYVAHGRVDAVSVIDLRTWQVVATLDAGRNPDGMAWSSERVRRREPSSG